MLKRRLIGVIIVIDGTAVQSIAFNRYLPIGRPNIVAKFLNRWGIDEILLLDISASRNKLAPNLSLVESVAKECFVPLCYGGSIKTREEMSDVFNSGADKICLNNVLWTNPKLVSIGAEYFGQQAIVVSIDTKKNLSNGQYMACNYIDRNRTAQLDFFLESIIKFNPGEVFINSIDRDGSQMGFDIDLIKYVSAHTTLPIISCGGAGSNEHFLQAFKNTNVSALAAGNFFNFTEHSVSVLKAYLSKKDVNIRNDLFVNYDHCSFLEDGRIARVADDYLEKLRFIPIEPEKI